MIWRRQPPGDSITEARCQACTILGGTEIETEEQRAAVAALPELVDAPAPEIGDSIELPPCVGEDWLKACREQHGRPCPRVELDEPNLEPLEAFRMIVRDDARALAGRFMDAAWGDRPAAERLRLVRRVMRVVSDPDVNELLYPKSG